MIELTNLERLMLSKVSEHHITFSPRMPGQVSTLRDLQERGLVKTTVNPLFGQMWALTNAGQKALEQSNTNSKRRNKGYRSTYR